MTLLAVGNEVKCLCGEWVPIEQGINGLIPAAGHRWCFYIGNIRAGKVSIDRSGGPPLAMRSHNLTEQDELREATGTYVAPSRERARSGRLSLRETNEIRRLARGGKLTNAAIAALVGCGATTVRDVLSGRRAA